MDLEYKKDELETKSKEYLIETILLLQEDTLHYKSEVKHVLKEWRKTIDFLNK